MRCTWYKHGRLVKMRVQCFFISKAIVNGSGGGVVDNTLDYQSRGRKIDPPLLRSFG